MEKRRRQIGNRYSDARDAGARVAGLRPLASVALNLAGLLLSIINLGLVTIPRDAGAAT